MIRHLVFSASAILALSAGPAGADEAYICDAGRIVYVKSGELEHLKRTDACIAGYYGLKIEPVAAKLEGKLPVAAPKAPSKAAQGLKMEREARAAAAASEKPPAKPAVAVVKQPSPLPKPLPASAPPTDFRNVLILNAASEAERIYRHEK